MNTIAHSTRRPATTPAGDVPLLLYAAASVLLPYAVATAMLLLLP